MLMLCKQTLLVVAASLAAVVRGLPSPSSSLEYPGLVVLNKYEIEAGTITLYGDETPVKRSPDVIDLERRCGSNVVKCYGSHMAPQSACVALIIALAGPQRADIIVQKPRSLCLTSGGQSSGQCCVSWANPVSNAVHYDLVAAATAVNNQCFDSSSNVSGLMRDTTVGSTCTTVCLSNRANGCR